MSVQSSAVPHTPREEALLAEARQDVPLSAETRRQIKERMSAQLGDGGPTLMELTLRRRSRVGTWTALSIAGAMILGAGVGASIRGSANARPAVPTAALPARVPQVASPGPWCPEAVPAVTAQAIPTKLAPTGVSSHTRSPAARTRAVPESAIAMVPSAETVSDSLIEEQALIAAAQLAIRQGSPDTALTNLALHGVRYPNGQLAEERAALEVQALAAGGRLDEARVRAQNFQRQAPGSLFAPKVRMLVDHAGDGDSEEAARPRLQLPDSVGKPETR